MSGLRNSIKTFFRLGEHIKVPDRMKGGRLERVGNYFHVIYSDYRTVFMELLQDMKAKPVKSGVYMSLIFTGITCHITNPSEQSFRSGLVESANELLLLGDSERNPRSDKHVQDLTLKYKDGRLQHISLGVLSLVYLTDYSKSLGLYSANCKYVKPPWTSFHKSIVDVGILGRWIYLKKAMKNYDVNLDEWDL